MEEKRHPAGEVRTGKESHMEDKQRPRRRAGVKDCGWKELQIDGPPVLKLSPKLEGAAQVFNRSRCQEWGTQNALQVGGTKIMDIAQASS